MLQNQKLIQAQVLILILIRRSLRIPRRVRMRQGFMRRPRETFALLLMASH
jgi:hypothetical protein